MKWSEIERKLKEEKTSVKHDNEEHRIQCSCVAWFRMQYPKFGSLLFAIPNGGRRDAITVKSLKDEGVIRGVADLMLAIPNGKYHGLFIEMKTATGRQSKEQVLFQRMVEAQGYRYVVCHSLEEFIKCIKIYILMK